jgi:hypothetical protein
VARDLVGEVTDGNGSWFVRPFVGTPKAVAVAGASVLASDRNGLSALGWSGDLLRRGAPRGSFSVGLKFFFPCTLFLGEFSFMYLSKLPTTYKMLNE